jgi:hypothetical protein
MWCWCVGISFGAVEGVLGDRYEGVSVALRARTWLVGDGREFVGSVGDRLFEGAAHDPW